MILITGFEPFGGLEYNTSQRMIEALETSQFRPGNQPIETCLLPVEHQRCFDMLLPYLKKHDYSHIFLLGMASNTSKIAIEKVAVNWAHFSIPDNSHQQPQDEKLYSASPDAYFSNLPVVTLVQMSQTSAIPVQISLSAGSFVCNELYFRTLQWVFSNRVNTKVVFIHLPALELSEKNHGNEVPAFPFSDIYSDLTLILQNGVTL